MKALGCLVGNASEIVPGMATSSSRQNVFLDIEKLTLRNGSGLEGRAERVHRREKNRAFQQDLLSLLGMGVEREERPQQVVYYRAGMRLGWGLDLEDLFPWPEGSQGTPLGVSD